MILRRFKLESSDIDIDRVSVDIQKETSNNNTSEMNSS